MSGFFGEISERDCVNDLFYGTDYHSHLGTMRGGMVVLGDDGKMQRRIHNITNSQFRTKFESFPGSVRGRSGIGVISDYENQPLMIDSRLGNYALAHIGKISNVEDLAKEARDWGAQFSEPSIGNGNVNPSELISILMNQKNNYVEGIQHVQERIEGSSSLMLLTPEGIYLARDSLGRTPVIVGKKEGAMGATLESCAFPNLGFNIEGWLGPGEIGILTPNGYERLVEPGEDMQICSFLDVYYGYPASSYEGRNAEVVRNNCGEFLAKRDSTEFKKGIDMVAGIPDSGTGHAIGYANESGVAYGRPIVKYTPTWPRSFMPQDQDTRNLVAEMKLIPIRELIQGRNILFCEDSIVRGTQLRENVRVLLEEYDLKGFHMRAACPPLIHGCKFLNFSRSRSERDLVGRRAIEDLEGNDNPDLEKYADEESKAHKKMVRWIKEDLGLTSLKYQKLDDLVQAIGLPKEKLCTFCWDGCEGCGKK